MMFASNQLGLIPDWQFSSDPRVNININPHVKIPVEWPHGQRTIQPVGAFSARACGDPLAPTGGLVVTPDAGLGCPRVGPALKMAGAQVTGLGITRARWMEPPIGLGAVDLFDSWAWRNRRPLVIAGIGLVGLAALAGVGALLR